MVNDYYTVSMGSTYISVFGNEKLTLAMPLDYCGHMASSLVTLCVMCDIQLPALAHLSPEKCWRELYSILYDISVDGLYMDVFYDPSSLFSGIDLWLLCSLLSLRGPYVFLANKSTRFSILEERMEHGCH